MVVVDVVDVVNVAVVTVVPEVEEETGSSSSRSLESSLNVDRLLLANTKCLMARITAVALYACCKSNRNYAINNTCSIPFGLLTAIMVQPFR